MIVIEYIVHALMQVVLLFFITSTWVALLLNLPILLYHTKKFFDGSYLLDATNLYYEVKERKKESIIKIVYYMLLFLFYLFSFIKAVIDYEASSRNY